MRSLILLCTIGFLSSTIAAQNFEVVSTYPADGAFGVLTDSVLITFSEPVYLNLDFDDLEESGFYAGLEPEDSFEPDSIALSDDGLTIKFFGTFAIDTDYLLFVYGAESQSGKELSTPIITQFTTANSRGEFIIRGFLDDSGSEIANEYGLNGFTALLSQKAPDFMFFEPDEEDDVASGETTNAFSKSSGIPFYTISDHEADSSEDIIPVYATLIDTLTGEFEITGVREGVYYPLGYNLFQIAEFDEYENEYGEYGDEFDYSPETFRYDADGDLGIDSIVVNSTTAPSDTLTGIDLTLLDTSPFTISEAFEITENHFDSHGISGFNIVGGAARYMYREYDFGFKQKEFDEHLSPIPGDNIAWDVYAYNSVLDSVAFMIVTPLGVEEFDLIGETDIDEPVDLSEIKALPEYINSDSAASIMLEEGVMSFLFNLEYEFGDYDFGWDFELLLLHEYWNYTPDPTPTAPVFWRGTLWGFGYDFYNDVYYEAEYSIWIDATTGEVLHEEATDIPDVETISLFDYLLPGGTVNLSGDSLVFIFDGELSLNLEASDPDSIGIVFFIEPEDSVIITGISYEESDGGSAVTVYVNLTEDTDYIVFLADVNGANGEVLDQPYILQFTTGDDSNRFTISGYLETPDIDVNNFFKNMIVMLVDEEPDFGFDFFGDDEESTEGSTQTSEHEVDEEEDDFIPIYAANVDPESGYFEITLIREGNYYPIAFDVSDDGDESEFEEFYIPKIYYYDPNEDRFPDILEINSTTVPSDTLSDLELAALSFDRFTLSEAIELVQLRVDDLGIGEVEYMGGATFFQFYGFEDISFMNGLKSLPEAVINDHDNSPLDNPFFMEADGRNFIWEIFVYHPSKDSALATYVSPVGAVFDGFLGEGDIEDPIEFDDLKALPESYLDSDSAAIRFAEEGGEAFIDFLENTYESGTYYWFHDIQALHEYWNYPFGASPDQPVAWKATYESYAYDYNTGMEYVDSLIIYLDVSTGSLLFTELSVDSEIEQETPQRIQLGQNYPNPFNPSTNIPFELSKSSVVNIEIFNLLGQKVVSLTNELYSAGRHTIAWNASNYSSGIYFYRLTAGDVIQTKKLMLIK